MHWIIVSVIFLGSWFFAWSLCRAASIADKRIDEMLRVSSEDADGRCHGCGEQGGSISED